MAIDQLWLDTLQRICARAAHEVKGALNGVSVNLEVVRSRAERADASAESVQRYAAAAAEQLGAVITMTDAVLVLARQAREPVEIGGLIRRLEALLAPAARADGRVLEVGEALDGIGGTSAGAGAVRLALGSAMLSAIEQSMHVTCRVDSTGDPCLRMESADGTDLRMDDAVVAALADAGIEVHAAPSALSIVFPPLRPGTDGHTGDHEARQW
jgi:signal transduction histidine kinase